MNDVISLECVRQQTVCKQRTNEARRGPKETELFLEENQHGNRHGNINQASFRLYFTV